ncbi:hypothetical protein FJQ54_00375 [Sandaracinobacter neustonicus]|uniref:Uncharacterized protein n=1 Tax=Sandaracinobacter neustonicus TaxID=1715348 RepID=A0A501XWE2_9SPHN|nr:hypothetical protein [Sandaracinobacter neustonicus]TPE64936.1 hypothetical protein FJQ54_00375 [Sandaracinobacter neustonicus]
MIATTTALIGPLALLAILGLNAGLLWRRAPSFAAALRGPQPVQMLLAAGGTGESNVIPFPAARTTPCTAPGRRLAA